MLNILNLQVISVTHISTVFKVSAEVMAKCDKKQGAKNRTLRDSSSYRHPVRYIIIITENTLTPTKQIRPNPHTGRRRETQTSQLIQQEIMLHKVESLTKIEENQNYNHLIINSTFNIIRDLELCCNPLWDILLC